MRSLNDDDDDDDNDDDDDDDYGYIYVDELYPKCISTIIISGIPRH